MGGQPSLLVLFSVPHLRHLSFAPRHDLTDTLILNPVTAGLAGLAVLFGLCGAAYHRPGTILMAIAALLAFLVTLVAWVL